MVTFRGATDGATKGKGEKDEELRRNARRTKNIQRIQKEKVDQVTDRTNRKYDRCKSIHGLLWWLSDLKTHTHKKKPYLSMQEMEKAMVTPSSILAWEIPWKEKLGGLQSMGSQKSQTRLSD